MPAELPEGPVTNVETLPCGCQMGQAGEAFVFIPCSLLCPWYRYVVDQSAELGRPLETRRR